MDKNSLNGITLFDGNDIMLNSKSYIIVRYTEFLTDWETIEEGLETGYKIAKKRAESAGFFPVLNAFACAGSIHSAKEVKRTTDAINKSKIKAV